MDTNESTGRDLAGGITVLAGLWLAVSPFFMDISGAGFWAQLIAAAVLLAVGLSEMVARNTIPSWISAIAGAWLIVSPFGFNVPDPSKWNQVLVGILVIAMAIVGAQAVNRITKTSH